MNSLFKAIGLASFANAIQLTATNQLDAEVEAFACPRFCLRSLKLETPGSLQLHWKLQLWLRHRNHPTNPRNFLLRQPFLLENND